MRTVCGFGAALLLCFLAAACPSQEPLDRLTAQLKVPGQREQAIDGLLVLVRQASEAKRPGVTEKVVHALKEAYRDDHCRGEIVAALALLKDPRAEEVFVAALRDADRGGTYFESAVRSARLIGELELRDQVPALVEALRKAHATPRPDRNTWLERSLIQALERLRDRRALEVLAQVLRSDPARQDFYLNRMAGRALGNLADPRAVPALVETLGTSSHGLLLFEENRRALCRIGSAAVKPLIAAAGRRDPRGQPVPDAAAAVRVIGDLGDPSTVGQLTGMLAPGAPGSYRVALAETLLHLGQREGEKVLIEVLDNKVSAITARRRAADLLGWLGSSAAVEGKMESFCRGDKVSEEVACMSVALAHSRLAGPEGLSALDRVLRSKKDKRAMASNLQTYRVRLETLQICGNALSCLQKVLRARESDWRRRERAALELGRRGQAKHALLLAGQLSGSHPQVKQAILVGLERLLLRQVLDAGQTGQVAAALDRFLRESKNTDTKKGDSTTPVAITSQLLCLGQRFKRTREGRR